MSKTEKRLRRKEAYLWITQVIIPTMAIIASFATVITKWIKKEM